MFMKKMASSGSAKANSSDQFNVNISPGNSRRSSDEAESTIKEGGDHCDSNWDVQCLVNAARTLINVAALHANEDAIAEDEQYLEANQLTRGTSVSLGSINLSCDSDRPKNTPALDNRRSADNINSASMLRSNTGKLRIDKNVSQDSALDVDGKTNKRDTTKSPVDIPPKEVSSRS